jgi:hypothetical protein
MRSVFAAAFVASVISVSFSPAYAREMIPARSRNLPSGIPNSASTSSEATVLEPKATLEDLSSAEVGRMNMESMRPHRALAL